MVGSDQGRDAPRVRSVGLGGARPFLDLFDDALPVVHRYLFASTGGDAGLADELTAATFEVAARSAAAGTGVAVGLGTLLDTARSVLTARVTPLDPGVRSMRRAPGPGPGGGHPATDPAADLRRLPLGHRVVLALRYYDHLPAAEIGRTLGTGDAVIAAVLDDARSALGAGALSGGVGAPAGGTAEGEAAGAESAEGGAAEGEAAEGGRLRQVYAALVAVPDPALVSRLRTRLRAEIAGQPGGPAGGPVIAAGAPGGTDAGAAAGGAPGGTRPRRPGQGPGRGAPAEPRRPAATGAGVGRPATAEPAPDGPRRVVGTRHRESARSRPSPEQLLPLEVVGGDVGDIGFGDATGGSRGAAGRRESLLARPGGGRLRRERSPRAWVAAAAVTVAAVVGLAVAGAGGGGGGRERGADPGGGEAAGDAAVGESRPPGTVPVRVVAPAEQLGTVVPEASSEGEVIARTHLGPGGPYMNGPYAVAAGHEGLWATAVGDGGAWQAVRIDPETGATVAVVAIPGRVPTDLGDHGIALSGGFVWVPALHEGLFRIDAMSNRPSGVVTVAGGVVGAAVDGGDGAVWAVGDDRVLRRIDARTTEVTAATTIPELGLMPDGADLAYGGGTVWVTVGNGPKRHLIGFDPVTLDRRYTYLVPPIGLVGDAADLAADLDRVVIAEAPPGGVTIVDGTEGRVLASHRVATAGIAVDGDRAWLLAPQDGRATVAWTRTGELLASVDVPRGVTDLVSTREGGVWAAVPARGELVRLRFGE